MTTRPGDDVAAGCGHLRASHADREQAIDVLKAAFVQGRLAKDEFEARIGQAFTSRTYAELADVTAGLAGAQSPRKPAQERAGKTATSGPARARKKKAAAWGAYGIISPALIAAAIIPGYTNIAAAIATTAVIYFVFWLIGSIIMIATAEW
jgi:hypothetical protein